MLSSGGENPFWIWLANTFYNFEHLGISCDFFLSFIVSSPAYLHISS